MNKKPIPRNVAIACVAIASSFLFIIGVSSLYALVVMGVIASGVRLDTNEFVYLSAYFPFLVPFFWLLTYPMLALLAYGASALQQGKRKDWTFRLDEKLNRQTALLLSASLFLGLSLFGDLLPIHENCLFENALGYHQVGNGIFAATLAFFCFQVIGTFLSCYAFYGALFLRFGGKMRFSFAISFRVGFVFALFLAFYVFLLPFQFDEGSAFGEGGIAPLVIGTADFLAAFLCAYAPETFRFARKKDASEEAKEG